MHDLGDTELLRQYAHQDSHEAFAALLARHLNLVYSAALRKTGSPQAAEDITQVVFSILAKKARALPAQTILAGWLYHTSRLTAVNFLRTEIRRVRLEQEAHMQSLATETEPDPWPQIMPLLDDAMGLLGEKDRDAIVLRFFEGKSFAEIASATGASENAAKKRVQHALEKLRRYFAKRGVVSGTSALAAAIAAHSVQAAPASLLAQLAAAHAGAAVSAGTAALAAATLRQMLWLKLRPVIGWGTAAVVILALLKLLLLGTSPNRIPQAAVGDAGTPPTVLALPTPDVLGTLLAESSGAVSLNLSVGHSNHASAYAQSNLLESCLYRHHLVVFHWSNRAFLARYPFFTNRMKESRRIFAWAGERRRRSPEPSFALPPVATRNGLAQPTRIGAPTTSESPSAIADRGSRPAQCVFLANQ